VDCSILKTVWGNNFWHEELVGHIEEVVTKENIEYTHECLAATWGDEFRKSTITTNAETFIEVYHAACTKTG
jgi:hypothetical protein